MLAPGFLTKIGNEVNGKKQELILEKGYALIDKKWESGDEITVSIQQAETTTPISTTLVSVLADPFGLIFDSEDGTLVSGARVSLVDAATGALATVFADDGVTPWPPIVFSGQPVTDGAGIVHPMAPGEYRFPLAPFESYRVVVEPPAP